jgi:hypothetical protein
MDVPHFIHSPFGGHFGGFQFLAITNKAAVKNHGKVFVWTQVFNSFG